MEEDHQDDQDHTEHLTAEEEGVPDVFIMRDQGIQPKTEQE